GCSIDKTGKFTAASDISTSTDVTVKATLKANTEVSATATVTIDPSKVDTSNIYAVNIYNKENKGEWGWCELTWTDANYAISALSQISNCTMNGAAVQNVTAGSAITNGYKFQFITNGVAWRGAPNNTLAFRVTTTSACYDITVKFDDRDLTETGSTTEVKETTIEEVKQITASVSEISFETKTAQTFTVGSIGIADFNVGNVKVVSSNTDVATVAIENDTVTVTPVADGEATITVSHNDLTATVTVKVQTELQDVALVFTDASKIEGSGINVCWSNEIKSLTKDDVSSIKLVFESGTDRYKSYESTLTKSDYKPTEVNKNKLYFTVAAGFQNGEDFTHTVTVKIIKDGKRYSGTIVYKGNVYQAAAADSTKGEA
ncbi:MAG: hypothetical protein SO116_06805, partial [Treponema sp.]|nr:hypothetical protein [Treponema sp.]